MNVIPESHPLRQFFTDLVGRHYAEEIGIRDPQLVAYVSQLLTEFCDAEQLFKIRNGANRPLNDVGEMLLESDPVYGPAPSFDRERQVRKHIGDYTLFFTGMFPESINHYRLRRQRPCAWQVDRVPGEHACQARREAQPEQGGVIAGGAVFLTPNIDPRLPMENGEFLPGCGAIVEAVATAAGLRPIVVGKPEPPLFELALQRMGLEDRRRAGGVGAGPERQCDRRCGADDADLAQAFDLGLEEAEIGEGGR